MGNIYNLGIYIYRGIKISEKYYIGLEKYGNKFKNWTINRLIKF